MFSRSVHDSNIHGVEALRLQGLNSSRAQAELNHQRVSGGKATTSSMAAVSARIMARRSMPRAMPAASGMVGRALAEIFPAWRSAPSSLRRALAALLQSAVFVHPHRSVPKSRWPVPAADVEFEALRNGRIALFYFGQCRKLGRIIVKKGGAVVCPDAVQYTQPGFHQTDLWPKLPDSSSARIVEKASATVILSQGDVKLIFLFCQTMCWSYPMSFKQAMSMASH